MFIPKRRGLRFLVGLCFVLVFLPFNPTTATDIEEPEQSRELTTTPPWATGSSCTPDGPFYNPGAVDECRDCCKERKCRNRCLNQCKSDAASTAQRRKDYCKSYRGYEKDGPPDWSTCSNKLGEYKDSHCSDYDTCVTKYEARHIADDAWYYCDDLHVPTLDCSDFGDCVYASFQQIALLKSKSALNDCKAGVYKNYAEGKCDISCLPKSRRLQAQWEIDCPKKKTCEDCENACCSFYGDPSGCEDICCQCPGRCPTPPPTPTPPPDDCTNQECIDYSKCVYSFYEAEAQKEKYEAEHSCKPDRFVGGKCDHKIPEWKPDCGDCDNWRNEDDWCDACKANNCDEILKELQFAKDHSKSGSKGRRAICDEFWYCIEEYERDYDGSESREKGDEARRDCNRCENNGGDCKNDVGDDHEKGKDDVCLSYLGGWDRSCNSYYDCWNDDLRRQCDDCANDSGGVSCYSKYERCEDECLASTSIVSCEDECDVCFCESNPELGIEECQAIGDDCCKDPYGWLDLSDMRSLEYIRECTSSNDCGTCRGNCKTNADCHNVNLCSKDPDNEKDIYDIPGCKGDPANVNVPRNQDPLNVGYCYNPNKSYPDRTTLTNRCLAETTTNGYGQCCGLPRFASQCGKNFNNYCDRRSDVPIIQPGEPGTGTESGTPVFELARYTGSYCGTSIDDICSPCPSVDNDDGCPTVPCSGNEFCITVKDITCPGCFVQTSVTSVERSGGGEP